MKYLQVPEFDHLNPRLHHVGPLHRAHAGLGSYSRKKTRKDKRLFKKFCEQTPEMMPLSGPSIVEHSQKTNAAHASSSSDTSMSETFVSRKVLFDMISILNAVYVDYDFWSAKSTNFAKVHERQSEHSPSHLQHVIDSINTTLRRAMDTEYSELENVLWQTIDTQISAKDCDIYYYAPDFNNDPFENCAYHLNYFFHNKKLKRMVIFTLRSMHHSHPIEDDEYIDDEMHLGTVDDDDEVGGDSRME